MNLPKDWSKKPDWLDKAKSNDVDGGGFGVFLGVVSAIALVGFAAWFLIALLF